jgi:hypothetical protein
MYLMPIYCVSGQIQIILCLFIVSVVKYILCLFIVSAVKYRLSYVYLLCQWSNTSYAYLLCQWSNTSYAYLLCQRSNTDYLMPSYCVSDQIQIILCLFIVSVVKYRLSYVYLLCQWY